jgi:2-keto-4-pentenoate hydratase/2-oxohepta-3-ene-1,7-dioic acid hydratase in catechol pathway
MKLATIELSTGEKQVVGVNLSSAKFTFVDLHWADPALPRSLYELLQADPELTRTHEAYEKSLANDVAIDGKLTDPLDRTGKILCIGLNYKDHAIETNSPIPEEPVVFGKFNNTLSGPDADIVLPRVSKKVDYEAELVVVIGRAGKHILAEHALDHVAGYMCGHDVSARDWQKGRPSGQWLLGKTPDTFAPVGPWLVTKEDVPDAQMLSVKLRLNDQLLQDGNTADMIYPVPELIAYISKLMTLYPGDLIFTGTPAGVGIARTPQVFLKAGDVVEVEIAHLGILRNTVVDEA